MTSITVPDSVTSIEGGTFQGCSGLTSVTIPDSMTSIGGGTFYGCSSLTSIEIPNGVTSIGAHAFYGCSGLTSITIPDNVTSIGESAFDGCSSLSSIEIPNRVVNIGDSAFSGCSGLTTVEMPKSVQGMWGGIGSIGISVFRNCSSLTSIEIPDSVTSIGAHAFRGCSSLAHVGIPASVSSIGNYAFSDCGEELRIYCDEGSYAELYAADNGFDKKTRKLQTITASDIVKTVGDISFFLAAETDGDGDLSYESNDESVAGISSEGRVIIREAGKARITIRASATENYKAAEKTITVTVNPKPGTETDPQPPSTDLIGTCHDVGKCSYKITSIEPGEVCFMGISDSESSFLTLANKVIISGVSYKVTAIADGACSELEKLKNVKVGQNVRTIGERAFSGCPKLASAEIPEGVASIGSGAFANCSAALCIICAEGSAAEKYAMDNSISHRTGQESKMPQIITASNFTKTIGDPNFSIGAITDGDGELTYESGNEAVAIVSSKGTVAVVGAGTAQITITASETENYEAAEKTITVKVNPKTVDGGKPDSSQKPGAEGNPQKPAAKKAQTITVSDISKTYGSKPFPVGAKASGGGTLTYAVKNPKVAVIDRSGTVTLKGCGRTEITVTAAANGAYRAATKMITLTVAPRKLKITSAKSAKANALTVKWKRDKTASGYIIECSTDKKFKKNVKVVTVGKNKTVSKKIPKLKGGRKYYVRACAYAEADGGKITGAYGKAKKAVKVKR